MKYLFASCLLLTVHAAALAETTPEPSPALDAETPVPAETPAAANEPPVPVIPAATHPRPFSSSDPETYSIVSGGSGLSLHKPMYLLPLTYSRRYDGDESEIIFQISLKQRLFGMPLYVAYTQKSFFQVLNREDSKPFRESIYNPEAFYRFVPEDAEKWHHLGMDVGIEHESNGQSLPKSRSWNRIYATPFQAKGNHLIYWKWWYRLPERDKRNAMDAGGDDNPDIENFYGYNEFHYHQQLFDLHLAHVMLRYQPAKERGAIEFQYSIPSKESGFFYAFTLFHGYGESLSDYNRSITRLSFGVMLSR